jgi:DNA-binding PadR family transcriptional regulator
MRRPERDQELEDFGRFTEPALLILISLADGPKHGWAIMGDLETFAGVTVGPGTLYNAITRLVEKELIAPLEGDGRQRPYKLTARGTAALDEQLQNMRRIASIGLRRLRLA